MHHASYVPNIERPLVNEEEQEIIQTMSFQDVKENMIKKIDNKVLILQSDLAKL